MKKTILILSILFIALAVNLSAQVKVNFYLSNANFTSATSWTIDLRATVQTGQSWAVGPTCIRINFWTAPIGGLILVASNPIDNANSNLSGNSLYENMTSTNILNGSAASVNIFPKYNAGYYTMLAGDYLLGTLKFTTPDSTYCKNMTFVSSSPVFNQLTALTNGTQWTSIDPSPCIVGIRQESSIVPDNYSLSQNYPNPFNPVTIIKFELPKQSYVKLTVFDILGREITTLVNSMKSAGTYIVDFDGSSLSSGIYYYRLETKDFTDVKKMMLLK